MRTVTVVALSIALCACLGTPAAPPPTRLANAYWWNGRDFSFGERWVRNGHFVSQPPVEAEVIDLRGSFACPDFGAASLENGAVADFVLFNRDPIDPTASIVAQVKAGHRVATVSKAAPFCCVSSRPGRV